MNRTIRETEGGSAFPGGDGFGQFPGMTLRDWFAGQALQGIIILGHYPADEAAQRAYDYANAMVAERNKKP